MFVTRPTTSTDGLPLHPACSARTGTAWHLPAAVLKPRSVLTDRPAVRHHIAAPPVLPPARAYRRLQSSAAWWRAWEPICERHALGQHRHRLCSSLGWRRWAGVARSQATAANALTDPVTPNLLGPDTSLDQPRIFVSWLNSWRSGGAAGSLSDVVVDVRSAGPQPTRILLLATIRAVRNDA